MKALFTPLAAAALLATLVVRALYVAPLVAVLRSYARRGVALRPQLTDLDEKLAAGDPATFQRLITEQLVPDDLTQAIARRSA